VTLYNHKLNDVVLSFVEPSAYPDKIQSLVSSLNMSDQVLFKVDAVDASFAETVVALDAMGMGRGLLILGKDITPDSIAKFISGTVVSSYPTADEQVVELRDKLAQLRLGNDGNCMIQVDHSFSVKGVGTVALGVVKKGVVKKHDNLTIYPDRKKASVKSIQVQDLDVSEAAAGVRLGLAMKTFPQKTFREEAYSPQMKR